MVLGLGRKGKVRKRRTKPPAQTKEAKRKRKENENENLNLNLPTPTEDESDLNTSSSTKLGQAEVVTVPNSITGFRIIDIDNLVNFVKQFPCPYCNKCGKWEDVSEHRQGLYSLLKFKCSSCEKIMPLKSSKLPSNDITHEVNLRFINAMQEMGGHRTMGEKFCAEMNIPPPPARKSWYRAAEKIWSASMRSAAESMDAVAHEIHTKTVLMAESDDADTSEITVSCDGSWQRRGFSSRNGVATVLTVDGYNCKVIDTETLSNHCDACQKQRKKLSEEEFKEWVKEDHGAQCAKNYEGSAGSMEPVGILRIFSRSEEQYNLQYTGYLGDGDSKSYSNVRDADIYAGKDIVKLECCGHIQKKMYNRLKKVVTACKEKTYTHNGKSQKGIHGKGLLTDKQIKRIQGHYGAAIRKNAGDVDAMKKAVWDIFHHRNGYHQQCPDWCPYVKSGDLTEANKNQLPAFVMEEIRVVFEELAAPSLLEKCEHGGTQNANESFHHIIWKRCPKSVFVGRKRLETAVANATIVFNDGEYARTLIHDKLGLKPGDYTEYGLKLMDRKRIVDSLVKATHEKKLQRREKSISTPNCLDIETTDYYPGEF
jgi:hypothetical protein